MIKHIQSLYLFTLFAGTIFFIPPIFVERFVTASALWMQIGICIGIAGCVFRKKELLPLPQRGFIIIMFLWTFYHIWQNRGNIENKITIIILVAAFILFYVIWQQLKNKNMLFIFFTFLALLLSLWGLGQFAGLLPSYNSSFAVTGPFDNPAGLSAALVVLLPFPLYCSIHFAKRHRPFAIIVTCLVITVVLLSQARTVILATVVVSFFFLIRLMKERNIKLFTIHYAVISISCLFLFVGLFFMKKDSANGRLLIWKCSTELIARKPVCGYGGNGFTSSYMNKQASHFIKNPESKYVMLADNVRHPFNEFVKWTVNYGLLGLFLTLLLFIIPLWGSRKNHSAELFTFRLSLISIGICAFFSYPFNYPFIRLMTVALLAFVLAACPQVNVRFHRTIFRHGIAQASSALHIWLNKIVVINNGLLSKSTALLFSFGMLYTITYHTFYEFEWHKIAHRSLRGKTVQMLPRYKSLYKHLHYKDLFLYNYAAELNVVGHYDESLQIARECDHLWADYDLQMLMADNCLQLQQYNEAESYLIKSSAMCPVKFRPLYRLTELYLKTGRKKEVKDLVRIILEKKVKIPSSAIIAIKNAMRQLIDTHENTAIENRTSDELQNNEIRQGETPHGAALPP